MQIAFNSGLIVTFVYPLLALVLGTLGTLAVLYVGEAIERERVRDVFARFVPAGVVDEVLASADENLRLGGVERDCTVLFTRPARLHELLRDTAGRAGDRGRQLLPERDDRGDPRRRAAR